VRSRCMLEGTLTERSISVPADLAKHWRSRLHHADRKARETNLRTRTSALGKGRTHVNLHFGLLPVAFRALRHAESSPTTVATRLLHASSSELQHPSQIPVAHLSSHVYHHGKDRAAAGVHVELCAATAIPRQFAHVPNCAGRQYPPCAARNKAWNCCAQLRRRRLRRR
jgi:hypothetical protein